MALATAELDKVIADATDAINKSGIQLGYAQGLMRAADIARECGSPGVERVILETLTEYIEASK